MPLENQDILVHFVISALLSMLLFLAGVRPLAVLLLVLGIGVGKEALDANGFGTPSISDMLANVFGMISMLVLFHLIGGGAKQPRQQHDAQHGGARGAQMSLAMQRARNKSKRRRKAKSSSGVKYKVIVYESEEARDRAKAEESSGKQVDFRSASLRRPDGRPFR